MIKKILIPLFLSFVLVSAAPLKIGEKTPDFELKNALGETVSLSDYQGKIVVLESVNYNCPFVKKFYRPGKMQAWQKEYAEKGVVWLSVSSSAPNKSGYYEGKKLLKVIEQNNTDPSLYLVDASGTVGRTYGAKTTPHFFIVNPQQELIYQGAIDSIRSTSSKDIDKAENYVKLALNSALSGQPVATTETKAYGCGVKY